MGRRARPTLLLAATLLALTTGFASRAAFCAPTVDLARRDAWRPGDLRTITIREDRLREQHVPDLEAASGPMKPVTLRTSIVEVEKCLETDPDGNRTKWLVWLSAWTQDNGTTKDETLSGAWIEVSGRGKDRQFVVKSTPTPPSKAALAWLARAFGPKSTDLDEMRRSLLPKAPVAIGDEWSPDFGPTLESMGERVDREKAASSARLAGTDAITSRIVLSASMPIAGLPAGNDQKAIPWTKGGTYQCKGTLTLTAGGRIGGSSLSTSWALEGEAQVAGHALTFVSKTDRIVDVRPGGTMPEIPKPVTVSPPTPDSSPPPK